MTSVLKSWSEALLFLFLWLALFVLYGAVFGCLLCYAWKALLSAAIALGIAHGLRLFATGLSPFGGGIPLVRNITKKM